MAEMTEKIHGFKNDIFLAGPPDRRVGEPYKQMIKDAFPDLAVYDWETYNGKDYQDNNHKELKESFIFVGMVPDFPMPALGEELGYFYHHHEHRIKRCRHGIAQNRKRIVIGGKPEKEDEKFERIISPPINPIILIWPDNVQPDYAKKTFSQLAQIVSTAQEAIDQIKENQKYLDVWHREVYPNIRESLDIIESVEKAGDMIEILQKDPFSSQKHSDQSEKTERNAFGRKSGIRYGK